MMLKTAHKILIGSGIGLGLIYGTYSAVHESWIAVGAAAVMTIGLSLYLRWFLEKNA
jgi:hypothetical protein